MCIMLTEAVSRLSDSIILALTDTTKMIDPDANWCWSNYVSHRAMQQADNVRNQLKNSMEKLNLYVIVLLLTPDQFADG